jgi:hypothetical protein
MTVGDRPRSARFFSGSGFVWCGVSSEECSATVLVAYRYKVPMLQMADVAAPPLPRSAERWAASDAFFRGDGDWGTPTKLPIRVAFKKCDCRLECAHRFHPRPQRQNSSGFYPDVKVDPAMLY